RFADLPVKEFADRAVEVSARLASPGAVGEVNPLVAQAFAGRPPQAMTEVARRYGELLNETDRLWQDLLRHAARAKQPTPTALPDPAREQLRQAFYGPEAPPNVPRSLFGDLALLPDRPAQAELQKLRKAVEEWRARGPGAPPRAMVLVDAPSPY